MSIAKHTKAIPQQEMVHENKWLLPLYYVGYLRYISHHFIVSSASDLISIPEKLPEVMISNTLSV